MTRPLSQEFDLNKELFNTVMQSLTTTFGLDALLVEDKDGGDVDTLINARKGIYATKEEKQRFENRPTTYKEERDGKIIDPVHTDPYYKQRNAEDARKQKRGELFDGYTGEKLPNEKHARDLDHVISAKEALNDPARVLAEVSVSEAVNYEENLVSTSPTINRSKKDKSVDKFLSDLKNQIEQREKTITQKYEKWVNMPENTAEERDIKRRLEDEIKKLEKGTDKLRKLNKNQQMMIEKDKKARKKQDNDKYGKRYYRGKKFLKNTALTTGKKALQMGARQALGMLLREMVLEFKAQLPDVLAKHRPHFVFSEFLSDVKRLLVAIWSRIKVRFKALIAEFKDGAIGGALANLSTTFTNIFFTTMKNINKWIRELWQSLVKAVKLLIFNPDNLSFSELMKVAAKTIVLGVAAVAGISVDQFLAQTFTFPMGNLLATFLGSLTTGVLSVGIIYYFDYSPIMQKIWHFLLHWTEEVRTLEKLKQMNAELDAYVLELAKVELNMDPQALQALADSLAATEDEFVRADILSREIQRRHITLPFEDSIEGTRAWLNALASKA